MELDGASSGSGGEISSGDRRPARRRLNPIDGHRNIPMITAAAAAAANAYRRHSNGARTAR